MLLNFENKKLLTNTFSYIEAIYQTGSYSKAAELLHKKQSQISNEVHKAEKALNVKLVTTNTRGAFLTQDGQTFLEYAKQQNELLYNASNFALASHNISGEITIAMTDGIGLSVVPLLAKFHEIYPHVTTTILNSTNNDIFVNEKIDIAITYKYPNICNGLDIVEFSRKFGLFASVDFIKKNKMPKDIDDLVENYRICNRLEYCDNWKEWHKIISRAKNVSSTSYSSHLLIQETECGMGVSLQPINYGNGRKDWLPIDVGVVLSHPCFVLSRQAARKTEKVRALLNFIYNTMKDI